MPHEAMPYMGLCALFCVVLCSAAAPLGPLQEDAQIAGDLFRSHTSSPNRQAEQTVSWAEFDAYVDAARLCWNTQIPGLAVTVVKEGEVVHKKGYGFADKERGVPATEDTLFHVGSITKSFTATLLGLLIDDGKLHPDMQIRDFIPEFEMMNTFASTATVTDILTHRTGLERHDFAWLLNSSGLTRSTFVRQLRYLKPSAAFRYESIYNNWMWALAGRLAEVLAGDGGTWESLMSDRLFSVDALGMNSSLPSGIEEAFATGQYVVPYVIADPTSNPFEAVPIPRSAHRIVDDAIAPAGALIATAADMARYIQLHLNDGVVDGRRILSAETMKYLHTGTQRFAFMETETLTLTDYSPGGFWTGHWRGRPVLHHGGNLPGSSSSLWLFKGYNVGVSINTNLGEVGPLSALAMKMSMLAADIALGIPPTVDIGTPCADVPAVRVPGRTAAWAGFEPLSEAGPEAGLEVQNVPFASFVGGYRHPFYGLLTVTEESVTLGSLVCPSCAGQCDTDNILLSCLPPIQGMVLPQLAAKLTRNFTGAVMGVSLQIPAAGSQLITFTSASYLPEAELGWPRLDPKGENRPLFSAVPAPSAPAPGPAPGPAPSQQMWTTLEVILISALIAWIVPVVGLGVWQCQKRDPAGTASRGTELMETA